MKCPRTLASDGSPPASPHALAPILIVDQSDESREVIRTVLRQRGWQTIEAEQPAEGLELARQFQPRVIVADLEQDARQDASLCEAYATESRRQQAELLVVGVTRRAAPGLASEQIIAKPYHYGALIRKIEQLCRGAVGEDRQAAASVRAGEAA